MPEARKLAPSPTSSTVRIPADAGLRGGLLVFAAALVLAPAGLSVAALSVAQTPSDAVQAHLERGLELAQAGQLGPAEAELRAAAKLAPNRPDCLSTLATVLALEKKFEESTALFEKALQRDPRDVRSRTHLAANLWQLRRYPEAQRHLKIVLSSDPGNAQAKLLLGMVSENSGDYAAAAKMLGAVPDLVRQQPEAVLALARSHYRLGERAKAIEWLKGLADGPAGAQGALLGAQLADEMRDEATAESLLKAIPASFPDTSLVRYRLAVVQFHAGDYETSERTLLALVGAGRKTGEILRLLGWCYHREGREEDAVRAFREAVQLDPADERNFLDLGAVLLEERKLSAARELAHRTVNAFPSSADALLLLASSEVAAEQFTDAVATYSRALTLDPDRRESLLGLARAQAAAGLADQARRTMENAIERFPGRAPFEVELARLLLKENGGGPDAQGRAERLLESAAKHDSASADAQLLLGELALGRGQTAIALEHLENAVRLAPGNARAHFSLARGYRRAGRMEDGAKETALYEKLKKQDPSAAADAP